MSAGTAATTLTMRARPAGFWDSQVQRWRRWALRHPRTIRRLRLAWLVWVVGSFVVFLVVRAVVPQWREGVGAWLWSYLALLVLFVVARTKTISWRFVAIAFSAGCLFAPLIALADVAVADLLDADINSHDGSVLVAGPVEESLKLAPLLIFLLVARRRARGFAVVDFILLGYALGLGFGAVEDTVRRTVAAAQPDQGFGGLGSLLTLGVPEEDLGHTQWGVGWLPGWSRLHIPNIKEEVFFGGHAVTTAIAAAGVGFGLRLRRRLGVAALVIPIVLFGWMVLDHAMYNNVATAPLIELDIPQPDLPDIEDLPPEVVERLPPDVVENFPEQEDFDPHTVDPPESLLRVWRGLGKGAAERPLLTGLFVAALVLDVRQTRRAVRGLPPIPDLAVPRWLRQLAEGFATGLQGAVSTTAPRIVHRAFGAIAGAGRWTFHTIADSVHDIALTLLALGDDPPTPAWTFEPRTGVWTHPQHGWTRFDPRSNLWVTTAPTGAVITSAQPPSAAPVPAPGPRRSRRKRWMVAMTYLRARRRCAHQLAHDLRPYQPRRGFLAGVALTILLVAIGAAVIYGLAVINGDNPVTPANELNPFNPDGFLANLLDGLADWWNSLSFVEQTLIVLAITGLLTWGLAPMLGLGWGFGATLGIVWETTTVAEYGHGLADLIRDPRAATSNYVENLTLQQALLDAFVVGTEWGSHGAAPSSVWRRQIDDMTDGADNAARRQIDEGAEGADEALPPPRRPRATVELPPNPRLDAEEIATMHRFAETPEMAGGALYQHPDRRFDYTDHLGRDIDQIGKRGASLHWDQQRTNFLEQIDIHVMKSDITVVDLTEFTPGQTAEIRAYIDALPPADQQKIARIGF